MIIAIVTIHRHFDLSEKRCFRNSRLEKFKQIGFINVYLNLQNKVKVLLVCYLFCSCSYTSCMTNTMTKAVNAFPLTNRFKVAFTTVFKNLSRHKY